MGHVFFLHLTEVLFSKVNDFIRDKFMARDGSVPLAAEIVAGGCVSIFFIFVLSEMHLLGTEPQRLSI